MPEPKVYALKSLSLNNTEIALHELEKIAKNSIDPRSAVRAIEYDANATINIGYMATALSFPLSREAAEKRHHHHKLPERHHTYLPLYRIN